MAFRCLMFSTALFGFWCSSHILPIVHAQAPDAPASLATDSRGENLPPDPVPVPDEAACKKAHKAAEEAAYKKAQQDAGDAKATADDAQQKVKDAQKRVDDAQDQVDAATQERDLAKVIADKKKATFQNTTGVAEKPAEEAFVAAATELNAKERKLAKAIRNQQSAKKDQDKAEANLQAANQALTEAQTDLNRKKAAAEASRVSPDLCPHEKTCDSSPTNAKTIQCLTDCIKANPCDRSSLIARGKAYLVNCLPSAAEADFRQVLRWCPDDVEALVRWARAAEDQQCWHTAIERYNRAIAAAERAIEGIAGPVYCCGTDDGGTYLYCAAMGRARSHLRLAKSDDASNCELDEPMLDDDEALANRALVHSEAALHDFTRAVRYAPCEVALACAREWIGKAQDRCAENRAAVKKAKASHRVNNGSAYRAAGAS